MIGIIGAMELEIQKLISDLEEKEVKEIAFLEFYTGKLYSKDVVIVKSNEGKVNSAIATQILISNFDVSYILNVGVAGALDKTLNIYDIAISSNTVEFDQDVTALGYKKGYTFGLDLIYIDAYINIVEKINKICNKLKLTSKIGTIISSDKFIVNETEKVILENEFNAIAVDMESASINHVAKLNNIPFVALRVISDSGNNIEYVKFANKAVDNISKILKKFFKEECI